MNNVNIIFEHVSGSRLYGINTEDSDTDFAGVALDPLDTLIGLKPYYELPIETHNPDRVIRGLRKFCHLALKSNPNILDTLFCPLIADTMVRVTPVWLTIYTARRLFLGRDMLYDAYCGYATSNLKKIAPDTSLINKRTPLVEAHGYDTKSAAHTLRLYIQAISLMLEPDSYSPRLDDVTIEELKDIRAGKVNYSEVMEYIKTCQSLALTAKGLSKLPLKPDTEAVNKIIMDIFNEVYF